MHASTEPNQCWVGLHVHVQGPEMRVLEIVLVCTCTIRSIHWLGRQPSCHIVHIVQLTLCIDFFVKNERNNATNLNVTFGMYQTKLPLFLKKKEPS